MLTKIVYELYVYFGHYPFKSKHWQYYPPPLHIHDLYYILVCWWGYSAANICFYKILPYFEIIFFFRQFLAVVSPVFQTTFYGSFGINI